MAGGDSENGPQRMFQIEMRVFPLFSAGVFGGDRKEEMLSLYLECS